MKNLIKLYNDLLAIFAFIQRSIWKSPLLSLPGQYTINSYLSFISIILFLVTYKITKNMPLGWCIFAIPFILHFILYSKSKEEDFELAYKRLIEGSKKNRIIRIGIFILLSWILPFFVIIWLFSLGKTVLISTH